MHKYLQVFNTQERNVLHNDSVICSRIHYRL